MKVQFSITICSSRFTVGWYVVTKGNSLSAVTVMFLWFKSRLS